ncbi:MAG: 30S ribosomal protein S6 [bacterium]|nr:30S ribosomal protein S6 [bacterium]
MEKYELTVIAKPTLEEKPLLGCWSKVTDLVNSAGGKVLGEDVWGKRRLAYRIGSLSEGVYAVFSFSFPAAKIVDLKRHLSLESDLPRFLLIKKFK